MLQGEGSLRIQTEEYSQCLTSRAFNVVPGHSYRVGFYASTSDAGNNYLIYGATDALCNAADFCVPTDWLAAWDGWTLTGTWFYRVFDVTPERSVMVVFLGGETGASSIWYDNLSIVDLDGDICTPTPTWTPINTRTPTPTDTVRPVNPFFNQEWDDIR